MKGGNVKGSYITVQELLEYYEMIEKYNLISPEYYIGHSKPIIFK